MKKILLLFFLFSIKLTFGQIPKSYDSLEVFLKTKPIDTNYIKALNSFTFLKVKQGKFNEVDSLLSQMKIHSTQLKFPKGEYLVINMKGVIAWSNQKPEEALTHFLEAKKFLEKKNMPKKMLQFLMENIMSTHSQLGNREDATKTAFEIIGLQDKYDLKPITSPYITIAQNLKLHNKHKEAIEYLEKAIDINTKENNNSGLGINYNRLGNIYEDLGQIDKSIDCFKKGISFAQKDEYVLLEAELSVNLGRLYMTKKEFSNAEKYLLLGEKLCREVNAPQTLLIACSDLGNYYLENNQLEKSFAYYSEAYELAKENNNYNYIVITAENLADYYQKKKDYNKAFTFLKEAYMAKDSVFNMKVADKTEELLRTYQNELKEQKIKNLTVENDIKNLKISTANKQRLYLFLGLFLVTCIGAILFYQNQQRKKTNHKLQQLNAELDQANKAKTRFFSILNHDLRGPVANLIFFLQLQKESPEMLDEESIKRMQDKTMSGAENLLNSMEDILQWSKSQMENFKPQPTNIEINSLFEDTKKHFSSTEHIQIQFENPSNLKLFTDENYLKTIIRNLTGNAIKALEGIDDPKIIWKAWQKDNQTFLSVSDNGKGATQEQFKALYDDKEVVGIKSGLGLHLIRDLAKAIDCEILVDSKLGEGTTFTLKL
ncbi:MAG TPA: tetratricopeptide repeat-containing sensor histidine kinase [Flavobacterium sp.]|uniref:tetratricopeptide repeat-containing sensor histidine kinase n=1 Tax=unclassified Flavobacterium TaxID=196869 RepID=UPI0025C37CCE|nr:MULTISPECIES: tetratricopeptide repeat-containing sensor histidine kinase [unclassified Flavobacterium]HRE77527.1 tetratricopeptide repeat-containing sensor histidine kinase [Flavobacterium sp.]